MPFTISHAVIAPPIAKLTGYRLPISALAIGSMTPDLYRLFTAESYDVSHHWSGVIIPDLFIGLFFCILWYALWRPAIFRWIGVNKPINIVSFDSALGFILSVIIALLIGISTHLIWDGLTHSDFRTFAFGDFLNHQASLFGHIYPMHRILQIGTSVLALPFMLWMALHYYLKYKQHQPVSRKIKTYAVLIVTISLFFSSYAYIRFVQSLGATPWRTDLYSFIGRSVNQFASVFLVAFSIGCILFLLLDRFKRFDQ